MQRTWSGGSAYKGNTAGTPDNTLTTLAGDRVFLVQLVPQAHPLLAARMTVGNQVRLSWPSNNLGYVLQSATNLAGPWAFSGLAVSAVNGTNFSTDAAGVTTFYRLQYVPGLQMIPVLSWQTNADGLTLQMNPGTLKLQVFSPRAVRVAYSLSNSVPSTSLAVIASSTNSGWNPAVSANEISLATTALQVRVNRATGAVDFTIPTARPF